MGGRGREGRREREREREYEERRSFFWDEIVQTDVLRNAMSKHTHTHT